MKNIKTFEQFINESIVNESWKDVAGDELKLVESIFGKNTFSVISKAGNDIFLRLDKSVVLGGKSLIKYQDEGGFKDFMVHSIHGQTEITFRK